MNTPREVHRSALTRERTGGTALTRNAAIPDHVLERMVAHAQSERREWARVLADAVDRVQVADAQGAYWKDQEIELRLARAAR